MPFIGEAMLPRRQSEADVLSRIAVIACRLADHLLMEQTRASNKRRRKNG